MQYYDFTAGSRTEKKTGCMGSSPYAAIALVINTKKENNFEKYIRDKFTCVLQSSKNIFPRRQMPFEAVMSKRS